MKGAVATLKTEFSGLRTGRASPALLDPVTVDAYGSQLPLNQVGNISTPEPRLLTVQVWDKGLAKAVDKAIRDAGLGLNPQMDGQLLRIPIPELNEERRRELAKLASKYAEAARRGGSQCPPRRHGSPEKARKGPQDRPGRAP
ncbi:MAG: ribosome-recycling factor [Rhizomicrobium sp.]